MIRRFLYHLVDATYLMQLSDFDFDLPIELIAQMPLAQRSASRLLVVDPVQTDLSDRQFNDLGEYLQPGDLLVFNDTRVIPARLFGRKATGGKVEVMVERVLDAGTLLAHVRASKAPKPGSDLILEEHIACRVVGREQDLFLLQQVDGSWLELLDRYGHVPLPPYIQRDDADARVDTRRRSRCLCCGGVFAVGEIDRRHRRGRDIVEIGTLHETTLLEKPTRTLPGSR